ncbi:bacterioferritin-associated ferredoxin [Rheinheimera baltica]|uniref:Bacterioferritin-associated ferredoxin n=1 Tax=Rheinheimera baltica TaxID=67576 RepID=A0ABT9I0E3_9GAMM|nr:bacterioferritin-associated ferredoxin [Rheinheimera baltica]MDP5136381.1 bacterioferritin-associated ferredoxin [Rheinheimera baltica]MDP5144200.1 bacterioferritin-associated ferredoxin [Rheinheimera baltica]MDP5149020.1 bacterioferritin-associated ferredoxin [Rheinheimera baltica]MDP5191991.1 bacterioferritin-associated ferredoxin [Rheinheimera baltica]
MYVCLCKAVTDKTIKQKVADGITTMRELRMCTGAGSQCGKCTCQATQIIHNELVRLSDSDLKLAQPAA